MPDPSTASTPAAQYGEVLGVGGNAGHGKDTTGHILSQQRGLVPVAFADELKRLVVLFFGVDPATLWGESSLRNQEVRYTDNQLTEAVFTAQYQAFSRLVTLFGSREMADRAVARLVEVFTPVWPVPTPRKLLQLFGTEWGRSVQDDVWLRAVQRTALALQQGASYDPQMGILHARTTGVVAPRPNGIVITDVRFRNEVDFVAEVFGGRSLWVDASKRVARDPALAHGSEPLGPADIGIGPWDVVDNNGGVEALPGQIEATLARKAP